MNEEEKAYDIFLKALNYRIQVVAEHLRTKYLPEELKTEYETKMKYLLELRNAMF
jgi:hypothetical protein